MTTPTARGAGPRIRTDHPLLTAEDEVGLARAVEVGVLARQALERPAADHDRDDLAVLVRVGEGARERFVLANVRLVAAETRRAAATTAVPPDDLFGEGMVALTEAVARWDHRRGTRFAGYALPWVRNRIRAAAGERPGQLGPVRRRSEVHRVRGEQMRLAQRLGRQPTRAELAAAVGRAPEWVARALQPDVVVSLHAADGSPVEVADPAAVDPLTELPDGWSAARAVAGLPEPVRSVVSMRYGFTGAPSGWQEIGRRLGRSPGQVRRLAERGLEQLRSECPSQHRVAA
ncbi:sigma-70 family RNA polymerase sigma factor [Desertihabitans brevis]|nr:sigma-70 family RNA polymerase sigma factor [Desertihabitans brevis]